MGNLIVVGNGFDLYHGKATAYGNFYEMLEDSLKSRWNKMLKEYSENKNNWTDFEKEIGEITNNIFNLYFNSYSKDLQSSIKQIEYEKLIKEAKELFCSISNKLYDYLKEIQEQGIEICPSLKKYFKYDTQILSFNYTNFAEEYRHDEIEYIHGSIDEGYIVFGYSLRQEHDFIDPKATEFSKMKHRKILRYYRFLKSNHVDEDNLKKECSIYMEHLHRLYSGRGGWKFEYPHSLMLDAKKYLAIFGIKLESDDYISHELESHLPQKLKEKFNESRIAQSSYWMNEYYCQFQEGIDYNILDELNYEDVEEMVIIGHSLHGDIEIFRELSTKLKNLKSIIVLKYKNEKEDEINRKIGMLENIFDTQRITIKASYYGK